MIQHNSTKFSTSIYYYAFDFSKIQHTTFISLNTTMVLQNQPQKHKIQLKDFQESNLPFFFLQVSVNSTQNNQGLCSTFSFPLLLQLSATTTQETLLKPFLLLPFSFLSTRPNAHYSLLSLFFFYSCKWQFWQNFCYIYFVKIDPITQHWTSFIGMDG